MSKKFNPYGLIHYSRDWSQKKIDKNNKNYWDWEIKYNGFTPPNCNLEKFEEYKNTITL